MTVRSHRISRTTRQKRYGKDATLANISIKVNLCDLHFQLNGACTEAVLFSPTKEDQNNVNWDMFSRVVLFWFRVAGVCAADAVAR